MKFKDGYWEMRPGVTKITPVQVRDVDTTPTSLTLFSTTRPYRHRGDTLNTPVLTTEYHSPIPNVIHVRTYHFKGQVDRAPKFNLLPDIGESSAATAAGIAAVIGDGFVEFRSGTLSVRASLGERWATEFRFAGDHRTDVVGRHSGHMRIADGTTYLSTYLSLAVGEHVYGLGERFTPLVKNGQVVEAWNEDGGTSSEQAYKNVPFYVTDRGYGVLVADSGPVSFEIASEVVSAVQFSVRGESVDYYVIGGEDLKEVLRNYTALSGRPALPPPWSFGLWLSTSFTTDYDEATVTQFVDGMKERDIPLHVFHFDCFWMREFQWVDFAWDPAVFPDPKAMIDRLKRRGLRISVWINPYIAQKSRLFDEGMRQGFLLKRPDGSVWQWDRWQAGMALVDFTNPGAVEWFADAIQELAEMGVDAFKTDFGERVPVDVAYHDGSDPVGMHNFYSYLYNRCVFERLEQLNGRGNAIVFARSATVGGQRFPVHWGGDSEATYESMAETLRGGLSLSLGGFGFWSHDIGGFEHTADPDLFKRWVAFGALSSHSRLHGNESYRVPWAFDEESNDVLRFFIRLKCRLMPYIFSMACRTANEGIPVMRAMVLEFPEDPGCAYLDQQYMLGDSLLVAPIFRPDGKVTYFVPDPGDGSRWTHLLSGETVEAGRWQNERHDYLGLPLLVRPNSLIPIGTNAERPDYDYGEGVCFHLFGLTQDREARAEIRNHDGTIEMEVTAHSTKSGYVVEKKHGDRPWEICLRGVHAIASLEGGVHRESELGIVISVSGGSDSVRVTV